MDQNNIEDRVSNDENTMEELEQQSIVEEQSVEPTESLRSNSSEDHLEKSTEDKLERRYFNFCLIFKAYSSVNPFASRRATKFDSVFLNLLHTLHYTIRIVPRKHFFKKFSKKCFLDSGGWQCIIANDSMDVFMETLLSLKN